MLELKDFEQATEIVQKVVRPTNLVYSDYFSEMCGNKVYLKPENMQLTGAYKIRGAYYKISTLSDEETRHPGLQRRKPRPGCGICGKSLWMQSHHCYANHHTAD